MLLSHKRTVPLVRPPKGLHEAPPSLLSAQWDPKSLRLWVRYWLKDPICGALEFGLYYLLRLLPVEHCSALGAWRGRYGRSEHKELEQRARAALARLRPDLRDREQINILIEQLRQNAGRTFLETLVSDRISNSTRVRAADPAAVSEILQDSRPVIFVTVHTANLGDTMGGALLALSGRHGTTVTRPFLNRFRQRLSVKLRPRTNATILPPGIGTTRQLLRHLQQSDTFVLLHLDEARGKQIHFPTFGRPLPRGGNLSVAIRLAAATGARLVPVHLERLPGVRYTLHMSAPLLVPSQAGQDVLDTIAEQLDNHFSAVIRAHMSDWLQLYYLRV